MRFIFPRSLLQDACSQKVSKNKKIVGAQVTQIKTGLSAIWTFGPLGVKLAHLQTLYSFVHVNVTISFSLNSRWFASDTESGLYPLKSLLAIPKQFYDI
jgi:hypothetical protein